MVCGAFPFGTRIGYAESRVVVSIPFVWGLTLGFERHEVRWDGSGSEPPWPGICSESGCHEPGSAQGPKTHVERGWLCTWLVLP